MRGPTLFNCLPEGMRGLPDTSKSTTSNYEAFKRALDKWLQKVPDIPGSCNTIESYAVHSEGK